MRRAEALGWRTGRVLISCSCGSLAAEHFTAIDIFELQGGLFDHRSSGERLVAGLHTTGDRADALAILCWICRVGLKIAEGASRPIETLCSTDSCGAVGEGEGNAGRII